MLIRVEGRQVKLLRTERSAQTHRIHEVAIRTFRIDRPLLVELLERLDRDECLVLDQWLEAHTQELVQIDAHSIIEHAPVQLEALVAALDAAAETLCPAAADALREQLHLIARSLHTGGHPRPVSRRRGTTSFPGQRDLVDELAPDVAQELAQDQRESHFLT
ncbi:hypothetical protein ACWEQ8_44385 [Streptomyces noursei]|jgi:hypothetical protein|uniref:Uncharacterized protein n=2 Tax=Bacteria TaxID=2 RepID=A0AAP4QZ00_9BURK|nr:MULTISPECIES: hypothetical protein [Burkholderia]MCA7875740.1 hypothetical protein [Burkholderia contaminans]MDN7564439.1 hypothetical protein [Burkholderia contaminans]MDN8021420.1 hypothetical protein [Burkholderia contaminans]UXZ65912.1 hypothetical protein NUJ29_11685 [Burkholderia contaminans]UXZ73671.1 hypothetical protein NUJ30_11680 [Burkholderia contaminans]